MPAIPCRDWLERQRARPDAWYTTWGILLRVSARYNASTGHAAPVERQSGVAVRDGTTRFAGLRRSRPDPPTCSCRTLPVICSTVLMRQHRIRQICTRDTEFHQFHVSGNHRSAAALATPKSPDQYDRLVRICYFQAKEPARGPSATAKAMRDAVTASAQT